MHIFWQKTLLQALGGFLWLPVAPSAFGQAIFDPSRPSTVLRTETGTPLATASQPLSVDPSAGPVVLQFGFGFATDEEALPNIILDSATIALQKVADESSAVIYVTADRALVNRAPPTPGTIAIDPEAVQVSSIPFPNLQPVLRHQLAFLVNAEVPAALRGEPLKLSLQLFDNQNGQISLAWISDAALVPEPGTFLLIVMAGCLWFACKNPRPLA